MVFLLLFILGVIFVEALTELIVKSVIFNWPREKIKSIHPIFNTLISCGYCTSVWVAIAPAVLLSPFQETVAPALAIPLLWLSLHRVSNYLHNINDKYFDKFYTK